MDTRLQQLRRQIASSPDDQQLWSAYQRQLLRSDFSAHFEALNELDDWNALEAMEQERICANLDQQLGEHFRWHSMTITQNRWAFGVFEHIPSKILLNLIPGGEVSVGSMIGINESPFHIASVEPFLISQTPVTRSQFARVTNSEEPTNDSANLPQSNLSWYASRVWLTQARGDLRLPTEAEWEYAYRAGTSTEYFWGDEFDAQYCWFRGNTRSAQNVCTHAKHANNFGLIDMAGNVWEWCEDIFLDYARGRPSFEDRIFRLYPIRGGSYLSEPRDCRGARRQAVNSRSSRVDFGIRVARKISL